MQEGDRVDTPTNTTTDKGDAGYDKALKNRHLQMIAIGGSIGTGLFLGTGGRLAQGGPGLALSYAVCGIFAFLMVRALGEMAIRRPSSGAFVSYAREFMGERGAYVTGWFFFLDWAVTVMADITAVALYLHYWRAFQPVPQWVLALIALAAVFTLNMLSVKVFGEAEFWFAAIKVAAIVAFMIAAIWAVVTGAPVGHDTAGFHNMSAHGGFFPKGFMPVVALTLGVIFAFGGTEMVGVAAGEAKDAAKILPKAINSMILRIFVFYVGSVVLMTLVLPYTAYSDGESPFVTFFTRIGIPHAGDVIQIIVLTAALSSLNAGLYSTGRTLRSLAMAGEAPKVAAKLNRHHVPAGAIVITTSLGLLGVALNAFLPGSAFDIVINLAGIGIAGTWCMVLLTHTRFLRQVKRGEVTRPEYRMPGAPYTNYVCLAFLIIVVLSNVATESGRWTLLLFALVAIAMVVGWYCVRDNVLSDNADKDSLAD
ncbi:amino acid permease [Cutibacterium equinum]|uniref:Amino acid permease n=1 Tax=Cutibacterium equinum TaxID=3016342 RepID=A0ABY7R0J4_9ACTN|nr:amino acid permease [Cutibacterium equinum]WCC80277.1 amino acid permease [Cutibacterium equinum]